MTCRIESVQQRLELGDFKIRVARSLAMTV
jgi:hypothetical protein